MNLNYPPLIETVDTRPKNRFPIAAQLGILGLILFGIFSSLLFRETAPAPDVLPPAVVTDPIQDTDPVVPQKIDEVPLRAAAAYVWDVKGQRALYSKNANQPLPLASVTKLMTSLLAYELVSGDTTATVSMEAIRIEGGSGFVAGERIGIAELQELSLVSSVNDAAYLLGASVGQLLGEADPEAQFVRGMNIRAQELGFETLEFWNTTGLDVSTTQPGGIGSASDVSFLMEYLITHHPELVAPTQQTATRIYNTAGAYHEAENTNAVATAIPNLLASKTGFTDLAGGNLTIAFDAGLNRPIIITVLGSTRDARFDDVLTLVAAVQESLSVPE